VGGSEGKPGEVDGCFSVQPERAYMDGLSQRKSNQSRDEGSGKDFEEWALDAGFI
jgi:hypothetical protein